MIGMTEFMHFYSAVAISTAVAAAAADKPSKTFESCSNRDAMCASNNRSDKTRTHTHHISNDLFHLGIRYRIDEKQNV